jgi:hypothetical protein
MEVAGYKQANPTSSARLCAMATGVSLARVEKIYAGIDGGTPLYGIRRIVRTRIQLLSTRQYDKLDSVLDADEHIAVKVAWLIYQKIIAPKCLWIPQPHPLPMALTTALQRTPLRHQCTLKYEEPVTHHKRQLQIFRCRRIPVRASWTALGSRWLRLRSISGTGGQRQPRQPIVDYQGS